MMIMMVVVEIFLFCHRKKIETKYFRSLMFFLIAPLLGAGVQILKIGLPFTLMGISFAAFVLFVTIQSRNMDKDYLTGAFNRQTLDGYLQQKIDAATPKKTFAGILLDIDEFKGINDSFGHYEGDVALISAVKLLRDSVSPCDFIARYGGDEFCIILENGKQSAVENAVRRIEENLDRFNENHVKPYVLSFSMGCAIYDPLQGSRADAFYRVIDKEMYRMKRSRKAAAARAG
jgi:diguanylate cyclase (GGDEF)-like protein